MKSILSYLTMASIVMFSFASCVKDSSDETEKPVISKTIEFTQTTTSTSITLTWKPVSECSWYQVYYAKNGEEFKQESNYQNLIDNPITYTISGLTPSTFYSIKMEGTDYAFGGKVTGTSKTITVLTEK